MICQDSAGQIYLQGVAAILPCSVADVRFATAACFPAATVTLQLDAAIASCGAGQCVVVIPATVGAGAPTTVPQNVTMIDLRTGPPFTPSISINSQTATLHSFVMANQSRLNPDRTEVGFLIRPRYLGTFPAANNLGAIAGESYVAGALPAPVTSSFTGVEGGVFIDSTGQTLPGIYGVVGNAGLDAGSTTNVTDAASLRAQTVIDVGAGAITNAYGAIFDDQAAGAVRNYASYHHGNALFDSGRAVTGLTVGGVAMPLFVLGGAGDIVIFKPLDNAAGWSFRNTGGVPLLDINNNNGTIIGFGGTGIQKHLSATASLNFTALAANSCETLTVAVAGAADGDSVTLGVPNALADVDGATERTTFFGWVSTADVVSVRRCNCTAVATGDPAAATVRADVWQH